MTAGVILAGGRSARMGTDKALVTIDGVPMAVRVADALRAGGCSPVWCQGGDAAALAALGLAVRPDPVAHAGPLAAIAEALRSCTPDDVVVAACDLPDLDAATVTALVTAGRAAGRPAAAAPAGAGADLVSWWPHDTADAVTTLVTAGVRSYREALDRLGALLVTVPAHVVRNVNRPGDVTPIVRPAHP